jgi:Tol biopolymer transport system component
VYTVPASGGNASKVTAGWSPAWASGSKLVVTDESEGAFGRDVQLYSVNPDGTGRQMLLQCPENQFDQPCGDGDPVFSPDATKITFNNNVSGAASAVYTMNADGSARRQLTPYSPPATLPQWGPNASAIVYERKDLGGDTTKDTIHTIGADGSGDKELVKNAHQPSWSPDGKTIVFTRSDGPTFTLFAMNADGTDVHQLTGPAGSTTTTTPAGTRCVVPKVVGKTLANAKKLLTKAHCKTGKVTRVRSAKVKTGVVVSAKPKPGRSLAAGTAVALSVSRGKK